jgi:hypothetical protein
VKEAAEKNPALSAILGFTIASAASMIGLVLLTMMSLGGSARSLKALGGAGLWQGFWILPLIYFAVYRDLRWFARGVWASAIVLALLNVFGML